MVVASGQQRPEITALDHSASLIEDTGKEI